MKLVSFHAFLKKSVKKTSHKNILAFPMWKAVERTDGFPFYCKA